MKTFVDRIKIKLENVKTEIWWYFCGAKWLREDTERQRLEEEELQRSVDAYLESRDKEMAEQERLHREQEERMLEEQRQKEDAIWDAWDKRREEREKAELYYCTSCGGDERYCSCNEDPRNYQIGLM